MCTACRALSGRFRPGVLALFLAGPGAVSSPTWRPDYGTVTTTSFDGALSPE
jgi:hypothetical protein